MNILSIDYGSKHIGLAIANSELKIAMPYKILENKTSNFLFSSLKDIINKENIQKIIVGKPIGLSGKKTEQTEVTNRFIKELKQQIRLPVVSFDERLTSKMADKILSPLRDPTSSGGRVPGHAVAAQIILQNYLDKT